MSHEVTRGRTGWQGRTRPHEVARGRKRSHGAARGHTGSHEVTRGHTRSHGVAPDRTRSHEVARGRTRSNGFFSFSHSFLIAIRRFCVASHHEQKNAYGLQIVR